LREEAEDQIPIWQMIGASEAKLHARALDWQEKLGRGEVLESRSTVGGGSLPEETLPTWVLGLEHDHPDQLSAHLRGTDPPVITRIEADRVLLDPRTVLPEQEEHLLRVLRDLA
jgi:L-seryl-tRNA(Ser) seleniumtransferase